MLISLVGLRSPLLSWIERAARELIAEVEGITISPVHTVDELRSSWQNRTNDNVLIISEAPAPGVSNILNKLDHPRLVCVDDLIDTVGYGMAISQSGAASVTRHSVKGLCCLHDFFLNPASTVWHREHLFRPVTDVLRDLARIFELPIGEDALRRVASRLSGGHEVDVETAEQNLLRTDLHARPPRHFHASLPHEEIDAINLLIPGYLSLFEAKPIRSLVWAPGAFHSHGLKRAGRALKGDLTGGARFLVFGPYLHLPVGHWNAVVRFAVDDAISGCTLAVDIVAGEVLALGEIAKVPSRGVFSFDLDFRVEDPAAAIEVRIALKQGSIEGTFIFGGAELSKID